MRRGKSLPTLFLCCAGGLWLAGCSAWTAPKDEDVEEAGIAEVAEEPEPPAVRPVVQAPTGPLPANPPSTPAPIPQTPRRWPLVKTVVQQLRQQTPEGWVNSRSSVELTIVVTPDGAHAAPVAGALTGAAPGGIAYRVDFQRIRFSQELPGQAPLTYDSDSPPAVVPSAVRPYHGLKNNGFQFRLNRDLQLTEVVGFESFVERCLQSAGAEQQAVLRLSLGASSPAEGVTHFVDEGVGLIPAEVSRAGDNWMRSQIIGQPVPCVATTRYTLRQVTAEASDVDLIGTITPAPDAAKPDGGLGEEVQVLIRGGKLLGQYRVDRRSGLPVRSHVEQSIEMTVRLADGAEFPQLKTTVTSLELQLDAKGTAPIALSSGMRHQPPQLSSQSPIRQEQAPLIRK